VLFGRARSEFADMILEVKHVTKEFDVRERGIFRKKSSFSALSDVSFTIERGRSFGLVGESGSGKTTITRCILGLERVTSGTIIFDGIDLTTLSADEMRGIRARIQIVFQDPFASLNPRMNVRDIVAEGMEIHSRKLGISASARNDRVVELMELVGLGGQHLRRYPHEFSGGQRQRICIARALALNPELLILDEPTSALDVSVQAQVLNLLQDLQKKLDLTYLFISHDLAVVRYVCDRVALVHRGAIVEQGDTNCIFESPASDYARQLLAATPSLDPSKSSLRSDASKNLAVSGPKPKLVVSRTTERSA
jgi:ABC-type oligopeptide transport system ATPase subunit